MFTHRLRRQANSWFAQQSRTIFTKSIQPTSQPRQPFTNSQFPSQFAPKPLFAPKPITYTVPALLAFNPAHMQTAPDEAQLLADIRKLQTNQADVQEKAILQQLIDKYGIDSDECKEFVLTVSDISPNDEIRMLSPCGKFYTQSIYYHVLFLRFSRNEAEDIARTSALEYEKCLVNRVDEELHFWQKAHELSSISAGFIQKAKDEEDRHNNEAEMKKKNSDVIQAKKDAESYERLAEDPIV